MRRLTLRELIRHGEAPVVGGRTPDIRNPGHISEVNQIEPAVENKPPRLPMKRYVVRIARRSEGEAVEEEESEDDQNTD